MPSLCNHCPVLGLDELILWLLSSYGSPTSRVCPVGCCGMSHPAQAVTKSHCKVTQISWGFWVLAGFWLFSKATGPGLANKVLPFMMTTWLLSAKDIMFQRVWDSELPFFLGKHSVGWGRASPSLWRDHLHSWANYHLHHCLHGSHTWRQEQELELSLDLFAAQHIH